MNHSFKTAIAASALLLASGAFALAQSNSTVGTGGTSAGGGESSSSVGTGGSSSGGGSGSGSASSVGTGGSSAGGGDTASSVGTGGSSAGGMEKGSGGDHGMHKGGDK